MRGVVARQPADGRSSPRPMIPKDWILEHGIYCGGASGDFPHQRVCFHAVQRALVKTLFLRVISSTILTSNTNMTAQCPHSCVVLWLFKQYRALSCQVPLCFVAMLVSEQDELPVNYGFQFAGTLVVH